VKTDNETEPKGEDITRSWRKLLNEELHDLCYSLNIIRMIRMKDYETGIACSTNEIDTIQGLTQDKVMMYCA
jgi:hypothetical protein